MYEVGDKIVCIENESFHSELCVGDTYTIEKIDCGIFEFDNIKERWSFLCVEELHRWFSSSLFIPLNLYQRKDKILKIKERINE